MKAKIIDRVETILAGILASGVIFGIMFLLSAAESIIEYIFW